MSPRSRRRRAVLLLSLALACGGLAASRVSSAENRVAQQVGPLVPAVVARGGIDAGTRVTAQMLAIRSVPQRFAPGDALASPQQAIGMRLAAAVAPGGYVTEGALAGRSGQGDAGGGAALAPGERAADVAVSGGEALASAAPGTRVDVLVTTDPENGGGRTYLALQDVELMGTRAASGDGDGAAAHATTIATLRVTLRQAVYLSAAESFAKEVRLLPRAPGDTKVAAAQAFDGRRL
jgi:pilus assembly protein CpaB